MLPAPPADWPLNPAAPTDMHERILHCLPQPALVVDLDMTLHAANPPAWRMLASGQPLQWRNGQLVGQSAGPYQRLRDALANLLKPGLAEHNSPVTKPSHAPPRSVLRLDSSNGGLSSQVLQIYALRMPQREGHDTKPGLALLVVHNLSVRLAPDPAALAAVFKLTPSETRVANHIAAGASARQIASHHGVAMTTVRSQIRTVFDKMGVRRQSELVALMAALPGAHEPPANAGPLSIKTDDAGRLRARQTARQVAAPT